MNNQELTEAEKEVIKKRSTKFKETDISCAKAIIQAAVNLELFTIPLYMTSMYSITGTHQISGGNNLYEGRWWPGIGPILADSPTPNPTVNKPKNIEVFNKVYKVFIEEMLHLQLVSNMATMLGVQPNFTSQELQDKEYGWTCYGKDENGTSIIPHILDFKDCRNENISLCNGLGGEQKICATINPSQARVKLGAMNEAQASLFIAIESTEDNVEKLLKPDKIKNYFPKAPFSYWTPKMTSQDLPFFGSIGHMYLTLWHYLEIEYTDGTRLLEILSGGLQRDQFNQDTNKKSPEYPGIDATIGLKSQLINIINAITDQGEGHGVVTTIKNKYPESFPQSGGLRAVLNKYQANPEALQNNYPNYNDSGIVQPGYSGRAEARIKNSAQDHFELFAQIKNIIQESNEDTYMTWDIWHSKPENKWAEDMLHPDKSIHPPFPLPSAQSIADALNQLKGEKDIHNTLSQAGVGTIKGVTSQLNTYWKNPSASFPSPAMGGSGDRLSICWAITGKVPQLWNGIAKLDRSGKMYHACQGMLIDEQTPSAENGMPRVEIYHSCKGSNNCKTEGGCGFVHGIQAGGNCGSSSVYCDDDVSIPANNSCGGHGGCAVPISASQLFPKPKESSQGKVCPEGGKMQAFEFANEGGNWKASPKSNIYYKKGDAVYDKAWEAYQIAIGKTEDTKENPPAPDNLRLAFPPST